MTRFEDRDEEITFEDGAGAFGASQPKAPMPEGGLSVEGGRSADEEAEYAALRDPLGSALPGEPDEGSSAPGLDKLAPGGTAAAGEEEKPLDALTDLEVLFSRVMGWDAEISQKRKFVVTSLSDVDTFTNEYFVFFTLIKMHPTIRFTSSFVQLFLSSNRSQFAQNTRIDSSLFMVNGESDWYAEFARSVLALYGEMERRTVPDEDFERAIEAQKMTYVNMSALKALEEGAKILSEGRVERGRTQAGYSDMRTHLSNRLGVIDAVVEKTSRRGIITYDVESAKVAEKKRVQIVGRFGIKALDDKIKGIREGDMVSLLAPSKGGKSRCAAQVVHESIVGLGTNALAWSCENGPDGFEALIRARHFNWLYNRNETDITKKRIIDSDMIRTDDMTPELRALEQASWLDFLTNPAYGRLTIIDFDFYVETFISHIKESVEITNSKLICIDYLQIIGSLQVNRNKSETIASAYQQMLQYLHGNRIAGIFPAQLKQTVVGDISRSSADELANLEMRDAAGESYEVIKTPDLNLSLYGTKEMIQNGEMKMLSIPSRNSAPFDPIDLFADLGTCTFSSFSA